MELLRVSQGVVRNTTRALFVVLSFILLSSSSSIPSAWAEDYTSDSFILRDPVITTEGGRSTSSGFEYFSTTGPRIKVESTSSSFIHRAGFLYFPVATSPILAASAGNGQVSLSWTASEATLANITDYQVGTATVSGGPYTFESVGNILSFTKTGLTNGTTYFFKLKALAGIFTLAKSNEVSATPSGGGGGGGGGVSPALAPLKTKVVIEGKAYSGSEIHILKDGKEITVTTADFQADFAEEITDITPGVWTFSIWAEDKQGRRSITFSFTTNISSGMTTTISDIFLPPTIELSKVKLQKSEILDIFGQTFPESEISISIESPEIVEKTKATEAGDWLHYFTTTGLSEGSYTVRAKAISPDGLSSSYSKVLGFYIGEGLPEVIYPNADLNSDGRVNIVDFSILLYWWEKDDPCSDQNKDGKVNLTDFSIMMYYWTG